MFEQVPDAWWWEASANLTAWFDWNALSALATVGATAVALWVAVESLTRADRDRRAAEVSIMKAVLLIFDNGLNSMKEQRQKLDDPKIDKGRLARAVVAAWTPDEVLEGLMSFKPAELPNTSGIHLLLATRAAWSGILGCWRILAEKNSDGDLGGLDRMLAHGETGAQALADEIKRLGGKAEDFDDDVVRSRLAL